MGISKNVWPVLPSLNHREPWPSKGSLFLNHSETNLKPFLFEKNEGNWENFLFFDQNVSKKSGLMANYRRHLE